MNKKCLVIIMAVFFATLLSFGYSPVVRAGDVTVEFSITPSVLVSTSDNSKMVDSNWMSTYKTEDDIINAAQNNKLHVAMQPVVSDAELKNFSVSWGNRSSWVTLRYEGGKLVGSKTLPGGYTYEYKYSNYTLWRIDLTAPNTREDSYPFVEQRRQENLQINNWFTTPTNYSGAYLVPNSP